MPIGVSQAFHVNVNCSNLERSLIFYRDLLGLTASTHTKPDGPQDGAAFGLDQAQWDAWILHDARGFGAGLVVDLLEWMVPAPLGAPNTAADLGHNRIGFYVSDLDDVVPAPRRRGDHHLRGAPRDGRGGPPTDPCRRRGRSRRHARRARGGRDRPGRVRGHRRIGSRAVRRRSTRTSSGSGRCSTVPRPASRASSSASTARSSRRPRTSTTRAARGRSCSSLRSCSNPRPAAHRRVRRTSSACTGSRCSPTTSTATTPTSSPAGSVPHAAGDLEMGPGIPPLRALMFEDPDGTILELIEPPR